LYRVARQGQETTEGLARLVAAVRKHFAPRATQTKRPNH
jgi:hypothetical protein